MTSIEKDVMQLAELIGRKEILIRDVRNAMKRLKDNQLTVRVSLVPEAGQVAVLSSNRSLDAAINSQSEWIIDRIYDTAIQNIEKEIAPIFEKIQQHKE